MEKITNEFESPSGMLSDNGIRSYFKNGIDIYTDEKDGSTFDLDKQLHVGSIDLRFRRLYRRMHLDEDSVLTYELLKNHSYTQPFELKDQEKLRIEPNEIILTTTLETVNLSEDFAAIVSGRSSIARLGVMVHCCQEFIHPGHGQPIPLQIINLSPYPVELEVDIPICQIVVFKLATSASKKYTDREDAKYADETNAEGSKIYEDVNNNIIANDDEKKKQKRKRILTGTRKFVKKYISPFLPSCIAVLVITPFLNEYVAGQTWTNVLSVINEFTFPIVFAFLLLVLFIFAKKGEE